MTGAEWRTCTDLVQMWPVIRERLSARKLRLFGVAYCGLLRQTPLFQNAVVFEPWAEQVADGLMTIDEAWKSIKSEWGENHSFRDLLAEDPASGGGVGHIFLSGVSNEKETLELMRCIAGNPFQPVSVDPSWLAWNGSTLVNLAQGIYDDRAFERLPILADALEDAGCTNAVILEHLRDPGPHVRGCFVIDLLLGKK